MLERERLESKKISKTNAVTSMLDYEIADEDIHVGPSDYVPWLKDRKWCHIRIEGTTFGDVPLNAELKLEVWDSPNSAGVIIDAIRCLRIGLDRGLKGTLVAPSSYFMKSPPLQIHDDIAYNRVEAFIRGEDNETLVGNEVSRKDSKALAGAAHARTRSRRPPPRRDRPRATAGGAASAPPGCFPRGREGGRRRLQGGGRRPRAHPGRICRAGDRPGLPGQLPAWPAKRRWSNANFGHVLGLPPEHPRVRALALRAYREYARYVVELMRLPSRAARTRRGVEVDGVEELVAAGAKSGRPLIVGRGHVGNNEAVRGRDRAARLPRERRRRRHRLSRAVRAAPDASASAWGVEVIPWRNLRGLFDVLRRSEILGLLVDWGYRADGIPVQLFDAWTTLPAGPATLAAKTGAVIVPILQERLGDGFRLGRRCAHPRPVHRARGAPARDPGDRRRAPARDRGRTGAVVQLQADVAAGRRRPGGARAPRRRDADRDRSSPRMPPRDATEPRRRPVPRSRLPPASRPRPRPTRDRRPRAPDPRRVRHRVRAAGGAARGPRRGGRRAVVPHDTHPSRASPRAICAASPRRAPATAAARRSPAVPPPTPTPSSGSSVSRTTMPPATTSRSPGRRRSRPARSSRASTSRPPRSSMRWSPAHAP